MKNTIHNWTRRWKVKIRVNRGYSSWTFLYENIKDLQYVLERHERVIILYLGDYDPSGVDMERYMREVMEYFGIDFNRVVFRRLAVTEKQIKRFNLPPRPEDADTIEKLAKDPRSKKFFGREDFFKLPLEERIEIIKKSKKFIVELDALVAKKPSEFKQLINNAIAEYWDESIYQHFKQEIDELTERARRLREEYKERVKKLLLKKLTS